MSQLERNRRFLFGTIILLNRNSNAPRIQNTVEFPEVPVEPKYPQTFTRSDVRRQLGCERQIISHNLAKSSASAYNFDSVWHV